MNFLLEYQYVTISILLLIILLLSIGITYYYNDLKEKQKLIAEYKEKEEQRIGDIHESLRIIALATIQDQCEISESCIRIHHLLKKTPAIDTSKIDYHIFKNLYQEIKKFATHEERKSLSNQERFNQDKERFSIEEQYKESYHLACEHLLKDLKS